MSAWTVIPEPECDAIWSEFGTKFGFAPSVLESPGIREPSPSETFSAIAVYEAMTEVKGSAIDFDAVAFRVISSLAKETGRVVALDWEHECYYFTPGFHDGKWKIFPWPDGEYNIFLSEDLQDGWFCHPWELSICVFGERATASLAEGLPVLFNHRMRRNGISIEGVDSA